MRDAKLPIDDRGLAYGDGLFETVLVRDGQPLLWDYHMARLDEGVERLSLPRPDFTAFDALPAQCGPGLQVLKLMLTRGSGGRGYRPPEPGELRWRWTASPFQPSPERWFEGVAVRCCELRLGIQPRLAGIKHLARLENVLARQEWQDDSIAEGLLCDSHGDLVEATTMNLIWLRRGRLETPLLDRSGVRGTLLSALDDAVELHWVREDLDTLLEADAAWLLNSVQGVWPIRRLDDACGNPLKQWPPAVDCAIQRIAHRRLGYPLNPGD
ncbi:MULTISPECIES: aminodeoxychorismate lyase [Salinicola]|uniref:Aminodeoxychorismate lyase n=1 Tax=Salinicola socius TaxID=404433 RepID=A0A1Q8SWF0_9GAMM|nr:MULTISPECIES: aminodeoxychorismate lyase [Salinicola]OLO05652.1 aminodeoxychorismate lyase [Salinicola socius]